MKTNIKGIKIFKLQTHKDKRGFFVEMYKKKKLKDHDFVFHCIYRLEIHKQNF